MSNELHPLAKVGACCAPDQHHCFDARPVLLEAMMFKHITQHPWHSSNITVWGYQDQWGYPLVADCKSLSTPTMTQRANARLIAIAPQMYEIIQKMHGNAEAMALVAYMEKNHDD